MGAEKSKLAKETGYSAYSMDMYEELYAAATRSKKEPMSAATLALRFRLDLDFCRAFVRMCSRQRREIDALTFADLVWGIHATGPASLEAKIDAAARTFDEAGDGFLTQRALEQIATDAGSLLSLDALEAEVRSIEAFLVDQGSSLPDSLDAMRARVAGRTPDASDKVMREQIAEEFDIEVDREPKDAKDGKEKKRTKKEKDSKALKGLQLRIKSSEARLAIALPLLERAHQLGGQLSLVEVQRLLINSLIATHGVEQYVPSVPNGYLEPNSHLHQRESRSETSSATSATSPRRRSRSPLKRLRKDESTPDDTEVAPHKAILRTGVPIEKFREFARANPALAFVMLHFRKFVQSTLLPLRARESRRDFDYSYAYGRPPIVIDLVNLILKANLAKTARDVERRRASDEEMARIKARREAKELDTFRRTGKKEKGLTVATAATASLFTRV